MQDPELESGNTSITITPPTPTPTTDDDDDDDDDASLGCFLLSRWYRLRHRSQVDARGWGGWGGWGRHTTSMMHWARASPASHVAALHYQLFVPGSTRRQRLGNAAMSGRHRFEARRGFAGYSSVSNRSDSLGDNTVRTVWRDKHEHDHVVAHEKEK
jgi:hypothetical protein